MKYWKSKFRNSIYELKYEKLVKNYTFKQWGIDPKKLPASTFNRLPVRFNYNEDYFNHCNWQGIPENGYTEIFEKLFSGSDSLI